MTLKELFNMWIDIKVDGEFRIFNSKGLIFIGRMEDMTIKLLNLKVISFGSNNNMFTIFVEKEG